MSGDEHPLCDSIQLAMLVLYFAIWGVDVLSHLTGRSSTVVSGLTSVPALAIPAVVVWGLGGYLVFNSHRSVFGLEARQIGLIDSGVYSRVRHPMYLGTMVFCSGFLFIMTSILSLGVLAALLVFYNEMANYEERELIRTLGQEYAEYRSRVPKWYPAWPRKAK
jgi:protein-S-isoprenylcysteine O-methyltransferase Ste14